MNLLEQLKMQTKVVADTSDIESIKKYKPLDATTNPSLIYTSAQDPQYNSIIERVLRLAREKSNNVSEQVAYAIDQLAIEFGKEILKIVPGRVSTEVDARLSFDVEASVSKARQLIALYKETGIDRERILIKVASTWEGIQAARILTSEGIHCNMTLLFSIPQAIACADAGVQLISPFVGRILDWYKKNSAAQYSADQEPGVVLVKNIFNYFKKFNYPTEIMASSFRHSGEIIELSGCDLMTISPALLKELQETESKLTRKLDAEEAKKSAIEKIHIDEKKFRWMMNEDPMATDKLAEGIRRFSEDLVKLEALIFQKIE